MTTRALDRALDRLVGDSRFSLDTHIIVDDPSTTTINEATEAKNKVKESRTEAALIGSQFIDTTWVGKQLVEYEIELTNSSLSSGSGGSKEGEDKNNSASTLKSRIALLRPGRTSAVFAATEEWKTSDAAVEKGAVKKEIEYLFPGSTLPGTTSSECYISSTVNGVSQKKKYHDILPQCPYIAHASVMFNMWPFGKFQYDVQALRYAELGSQKPTPQLPSIWNSTQATSVPTPTDTPDPLQPTATSPPSPPTNTPAPTNTPSNDCPYTDPGIAASACCIAICGGSSCCYTDPSPCAAECTPPNQGRWRCLSNCTGT